MGYQSAYLGSNVVSSYLHIDNLRMDLITGKFFETAGTKYLQVSHDGTDGILASSSGLLKLKPASSVRMYAPLGVKYIEAIHDETDGTIACSSGDLFFKAAGNDFRHYNGAATYYLLTTIAAGGTKFASSAGYVQLQPQSGQVLAATTGTACYIQCVAADNTNYTQMSSTAVLTSNAILRLACASGVFRFTDQDGTGNPAGATKLKLWDAGAAAWKNLYINNNTVTLEAG